MFFFWTGGRNTKTAPRLCLFPPHAFSNCLQDIRLHRLSDTCSGGAYCRTFFFRRAHHYIILLTTIIRACPLLRFC